MPENKLVFDMDIKDRIKTCMQTRQATTKATQKVLNSFKSGSEVDLRDQLQTAMARQANTLPEGWYNPPPAGIGVLFAGSHEVCRSKFASLRQQQCWPQPKYMLGPETVGMVYASPLNKNGTIADFGFSFYNGSNQKIKDYLSRCLESLEEVADQVKVGMRFNELHKLGGQIFAGNRIAGQQITALHSTPGTNLGHTVPWSYELPTPAELAIIEGNNVDERNNIISHKRLYLDAVETFVIPQTIAFTIESQLADREDRSLPNAFFHLIVTFIDGQKQVLSGFNPIFDTLGMDYIRSRF